jgi:hypothetical protein
MRSNQPQTAEFVRRFFGFLERQGVASASLHGWQGGFEGELSDVDFVIEPRGYDRIAALVHEHCQAEGWLLCQILRHETTAAYCICVSTSDPMEVVALDACSDYQRNGMFYLKAGEMLEDTLPMPWGGKCLNEKNHLLYRVLKAAGKAKDVEASALEFLAFPEVTRSWVAERIRHQWNVHIDSWDAGTLRLSLPRLSKKCFSFKHTFGPSALWRCAKRLIQPTGVILRMDPRMPAAPVHQQLAPLFRKVKESKNPGLALWQDVVTSTCTIVPQIPKGLQWLLKPESKVDAIGELESTAITQLVVKTLHRRCARWNHIAPTTDSYQIS